MKQGDDLYVKSGERETYREGYIVQNIDCTPGSEYVEFNQGRFIELGQEVGGLGDDIMKAQVYETVEQHLKKERALRGKGIKVLSLFFIDRVANYRIYNDDGSTSLGKIEFGSGISRIDGQAHLQGPHPVRCFGNPQRLL